MYRGIRIESYATLKYIKYTALHTTSLLAFNSFKGQVRQVQMRDFVKEYGSEGSSSYYAVLASLSVKFPETRHGLTTPVFSSL